MKIAIIGNANITKDYSKEIDACDIVIRCNDAKNYMKNTGSKINVLCIRNIGVQIEEKFCETKSISHIKDHPMLEEIWFPRFKKNTRDCSAEILRSNNLMQKKVTNFTEELNESLEVKIKAYCSEKNIIPSTGILVLWYVLNNPKYTGYDKFIYGFSFDMWLGHCVKAERILIEKWCKERKDLHFVPSNRFWRIKRLIKDSLFYSKLKTVLYWK